MGRMSASPGTMTLGYTLPDLGDVDYKQLDIRLPDGVQPTTRLEIWNEAAGEWRSINWKTGSASYQKASDYVANGDLVQIRVRVSEWTTMALPEIKLKGSVQP